MNDLKESYFRGYHPTSSDLDDNSEEERDKSEEPQEGNEFEELQERNESEEPQERDESEEPQEGDKSGEPQERNKSEEPQEGDEFEQPHKGDKSEELHKGDNSDSEEGDEDDRGSLMGFGITDYRPEMDNVMEWYDKGNFKRLNLDRIKDAETKKDMYEQDCAIDKSLVENLLQAYADYYPEEECDEESDEEEPGYVKTE
ncbi:unnamed protein product [Zymoseptoria tritici ST99CH_1A5]|uniref:Uncharacterized protein n=1 Tax=Zymoseptoria tritici ST99CH_1A5 TaxID=1276529 RepID=A0A1Y6M3B1_ZYMTR|nr:unnamed protein product [Zymoseptoria tritici ST99CH_1A5]